ncbi:MAG: hypothetical protein U0T69_09225 [Chitinophagales bacterium]
MITELLPFKINEPIKDWLHLFKFQSSHDEIDLYKYVSDGKIEINGFLPTGIFAYVHQALIITILIRFENASQEMYNTLFHTPGYHEIFSQEKYDDEEQVHFRKVTIDNISISMVITWNDENNIVSIICSNVKYDLF